MRSLFRHAAVLGAAASLFVAGVIVASAAAGQPGGGGSTGPAPGGSGGHVKPAVATTNSAPVPTFQPSPATTIYVPIVPCRIVDTRVAGGKMTTGSTRNFAVSGSTGFAGQGGNSTGCGIPSNAVEISASIIAVNAAVSGHLNAWAVGSSQPTASVLNFQQGQNTGTGAQVPIQPNANPALSVFAGSGPLDLVIDVTGYYVTQTHLIILADGTVWYGTNGHLKSLIHNPSSGLYELTFDRGLDGCNVLTSSNDARDVQAVGSWGGATLDVSTSHESAGVFSAADESFQLFIAC